MKKTTIITSVVNGRIKRNRHLVTKIFQAYEGKNLKLTFESEGKKRSNPQNAYYWGVIVPLIQEGIFNEWGEYMSKEQVHEMLKYNCNYKEIVNENTGEIIRSVRSTSDNSTITQEDYHEKCRRLAFNYFNVEIPLPNEELTLKFK
ncbi:hypothetical protein ETU10_08410 [Apibacter muscae]|uniref:Recombinase n=1 Tax=Apibacter muscae TaxID=2509004 RepID=A0A563DE26_9FLAO|nr:hypothetical protein [Apibacter muscae]TWP23108.1 hypothetical protein ETU10_08410 [Apibacter muscae]TWP28456.1 hypothetical protein ETU09_05900 [Apibacter muscae]